MVLALGIDTGGTFTDSVIFDLIDERVVAKAKAFTTYNNLTLGIAQSVENLNYDKFSDLRLVSLSTTMATNAIVEGRGCEVGIILIGEEPKGLLPVKHYAVVHGGHDIRGNPKEDLDLEEIVHVLESFKGKVQAIAVSGFASVRNPEHELKIRELVEQHTDLPVVCGHQLTTSLGFHERTVTAALNAKLIPTITELINSAKEVLSAKGIQAPLMIVKGDGTLMSESQAAEKPIETILSGPAASVIGATVLTKSSQALVLDMGGTTTDIAILKNGIPRINPEGALVGGWLTRVQAADIHTYGLGGDSYMTVSKDGNLVIGPQKVWPLSLVGMKYPYLFEELECQRKQLIKLRSSDAADAFLLLRDNPSDLTETEKAALNLLQSGPHTLFYLAEAIGKNPFSFNLDRLIKKGIVAKVAMTPTDILHVRGTFNEWNKGIAELGVNLLADLMNRRPEGFAEFAFGEIVNKLCLTVLRSLLSFEGAPPDTVNSVDSNYLINKVIKSDGQMLQAALKIAIPIVGIGAPVAAFLPEVARKLNCEPFIPKDYDVANAVGAAASKIMETIKILIKPTVEGYYLYSQWERKNFNDLEEAQAYALEQVEKRANQMAEKAGSTDYKITKKVQDIYSNGGAGPHLETIIEATIIGRPAW